MNLSRCERGHFFDQEKFATCPHCAQGAEIEGDMTEVLTEELSGSALEALEITRGDMEEVTVAGAPITDEADEDQTVAFYDEFFSTPMNNSAAAPASAGNAPAKTVSKVTTPCVGWLVATNGVHLGQDFRLKTGRNFIGRDSQMDIALEGEKRVSRNRHAIVVYEPKKHMYLVQPGESSELVYLNNELVLNPVVLNPYDVISLGEVDLLFMPLCGEKFNWTSELKKEE